MSVLVISGGARMGGLDQWDVDYNSLRRHYTGSYLFLTLEHSESSLDEVRMTSWEAEQNCAPLDVSGEGWVTLLSGAIAGVVRAASFDDALEWLDEFTRMLWPGKLKGVPRGLAPRLDGPNSFDGPLGQPVVRLNYTRDPALAEDFEWGLGREVTERIAATVSNWASIPHSTLYLRYGTDAPVETADLTQPILESALRGSPTGLYAERRAAGRYQYALREALLRDEGKVGYLWWDETLAWHDMRPALERVLLSDAPALDHGFIAYAKSTSEMAEQTVMFPDGIREFHLRNRYREALSFMTPDAFGMQVLREGHLHSANDLSAWSIDELGNGRFLVTHPEVDEWYADARPPADMLASAREDFRGALMTPERLDDFLNARGSR